MSISRHLAALVAALSISALSIGTARAESPVFTSAAYANASNPAINGYCSDCDAGQHVGDQFVLSSTATLSSTDFAVTAYYQPPWNIEISIYDSSKSLLYSHINTAGSYTMTDVGNQVVMVHAGISGLTLNAGTYYVYWYDPDGMGIPAYGGGNTLQINNGTAGYVAAFQINAVPEPETYAMLLAGLAMIGVVRRRRQA
jgi:hypothetical protein